MNDNRMTSTQATQMRGTGFAAIVTLGLILTMGLTGCMYYSWQEDATMNNHESSFVHIVFFWLKDGTTDQQKQQLIDDCKTYLGTVKTVQRLEVGTPAGTPRDVVDNSWHVNIVVHFKDAEAHDYYQKAQKHLDFIERNQDIWERVQVYDMIPDK